MKKLLFILIIAGGGYYYFQGDNKESLTVSEVINTSGTDQSDFIKVKGKVKSNFKMFYGIYELQDSKSGETIMVSTMDDLPKIGTEVTKKVKRNDVITINDKTFSLYEEAD